MSVLEARRRGAAKKFTWKKYTVAQTYVNKETAINKTITDGEGTNGWLMYSTAGSIGSVAVNGAKFKMPYRTYPAEYATSLYSSYRFFVPSQYVDYSYVTEYSTIYYCDTASGNLDYGISTIHASKQYTRVLANQQGSYIEDVTSTDENAYPANGVQDGYWYVKQ